MNTTTTDRADKYEAAARANMAAGFQNETRRKQDGIELVSRAYSELRQQLHSAVVAAIHKEEGEGRNDALWQREAELCMPFDLHNLREKHSTYALEMAPGMADVVKRIEALLVLRNEIKAMALLPRKTPKREQLPQAGDKTQQRGHCQCCAREHAVNHYVAQHGYTVEHGFFNGVCPGYQFQPMEKDRRVTDSTANAMRTKAGELEADALRVKAGELKPLKAPTGPWHGAEMVPFAEAKPHWQEHAVKTLQHNLEQQARAHRSTADTLQAMADKYHGQPLRIVKV